MDSIKTILHGNRRLIPESPAGAGSARKVKLPTECMCRTINGQRIGFIEATEFEDGTPITIDDREFGLAYECPCNRIDPETLKERLLRWSNLPGERRLITEYRTDTQAQRDAAAAVQQWVSGNTPEPWLFLYGGLGTGKTHLAVAAAHMLIGSGVRVRWEYVPQLLQDLRDAIAQDREAEQERVSSRALADRRAYLDNVDVLILDDLGAERATDWAQEELLKIFNGRYEAKGPLLITSNVAPEQIEPRIMSRITDTWMCRHVPFLWDDYRPRKGLLV